MQILSSPKATTAWRGMESEDQLRFSKQELSGPQNPPDAGRGGALVSLSQGTRQWSTTCLWQVYTFAVSKAIYSARQHPILFQTVNNSNVFLFFYVFMFAAMSGFILLCFPNLTE